MHYCDHSGLIIDRSNPKYGMIVCANIEWMDILEVPVNAVALILSIHD